MSDDEARAGHEDEKDEVEAQKHKLNLRNAEAKDEAKGEGDDDFEGHRRIAKL